MYVWFGYLGAQKYLFFMGQLFLLLHHVDYLSPAYHGDLRVIFLHTECTEYTELRFVSLSLHADEDIL